MLLIQFIILVIVALVWWRLFARWQTGELRVVEFLGWSGLWLIVAVAALLPQTTSYLANVVGVGRGSDLAIYVAVLLVFYLVLKIYLRLDILEKKIITLVRQRALDKAEEIAPQSKLKND